MLHQNLNCKEGNNCKECIFHNLVKGFVFIENNLQSYEEGHMNLRDIKIKKTAQRVHFENKTKHEKKRKGINDIGSFWIRLQLANLYCCSLDEINCLNN